MTTIFRLRNPVQEYAWGSKKVIAELLGSPNPKDVPQAELWLGAHPQDPSQVQRDGVWGTLLDAVAQEPEQLLGAQCARQFGPRLPFLLKVLAAARPLSLQAHPSAEQARAGFAREDAEGIARGAANRCYRDPYHKPELLCALTEFDALCGFRLIPETLKLFDALALTSLAELARPLREQPDANGLRAVFAALMSTLPDRVEPLVSDTLDACRRVRDRGGEFASECDWAVRLGELYPGDRGVVCSLLLNLVRLKPGDAMYLPAGRLHSYLCGAGVEIMASSDNVLRGGLTPKHVDASELMSVIDFQPGQVELIKARPGAPLEVCYAAPVAEFMLSRVELAVSQTFRSQQRRGPEVLLCTQGIVSVTGTGGARIPMARGESVFVAASCESYELCGEGRVFRAAVGAAP